MPVANAPIIKAGNICFIPNQAPIAITNLTSPAPKPPNMYGTTRTTKANAAPDKLNPIPETPAVALWNTKADKKTGKVKALYTLNLQTSVNAATTDAANTIAMSVWGMVEGGWASEHDAVIAKKVIHVLCGGNVAAGTEMTEQDYLDLEREAFLSLCGMEKSQARMQSILMTNKPLRN